MAQLHPEEPPQEAIEIDTDITAEDEADILEVFGVNVSDLQEDIATEVVEGMASTYAITGTSKYVESVNTFDMSLGHHFLVLHMPYVEGEQHAVEVIPSQGSGKVMLDESGVALLQLADQAEMSQVIRFSVVDAEDPSVTLNFTDFVLTGVTWGEA